jgi:hypothetical protein
MTGLGKLGNNESDNEQSAKADTNIQKEPRMLLEKPAHKLLGFGLRGRIALSIVVRWTLHVISVTNAHIEKSKSYATLSNVQSSGTDAERDVERKK